MSDPERLLESGAVDPEVRDLLQSLRAIKPSTGAALGSWGAMAAKVAMLPSVVPPPSTAPVAPHAVISGASHALVLKLSAVLAAASVIGGGLYWAHVAKRGTTQTPASAPSALVAPARPAPVAAPDGNAQAAEAAADSAAPVEDVTPTPATQAPISAASRVSRLDAEASMLSKVRAALRSGDAHGALLALNQLQVAFPKGALGQERDVLAIEVLAANGNTAAAARKARAFIAAHPSSPHSAKLERFLEAQ